MGGVHARFVSNYYNQLSAAVDTALWILLGAFASSLPAHLSRYLVYVVLSLHDVVQLLWQTIYLHVHVSTRSRIFALIQIFFAHSSVLIVQILIEVFPVNPPKLLVPVHVLS